QVAGRVIYLQPALADAVEPPRVLDDDCLTAVISAPVDSSPGCGLAGIRPGPRSARGQADQYGGEYRASRDLHAFLLDVSSRRTRGVRRAGDCTGSAASLACYLVRGCAAARHPRDAARIRSGCRRPKERRVQRNEMLPRMWNFRILENGADRAL